MGRSALQIICDVGIFIIISCITLLYPLIKRAQQKRVMTKDEYVFASGVQVPLFSIIFSICRIVLGVRGFLGFPSELFYRGSGMWETIYGISTALPLVCVVFLPVFGKLQILSVYKYLEMR